jgi:hypothetical protein
MDLKYTKYCMLTKAKLFYRNAAKNFKNFKKNMQGNELSFAARARCRPAHVVARPSRARERTH